MTNLDQQRDALHETALQNAASWRLAEAVVQVYRGEDGASWS